MPGYSDIYTDTYDAGTNGWGSIGVQIAWDDDPLTFSPAWSDVTPYVLDITTRRGHNPDQQPFDTGVATIVLDDATGRFNPLNTAGPFYNKLISYRQLRIVALDSTGTPQVFFRGHVQPGGWVNTPQLPGTASTTVTASDIFQMAARFDVAPTDPTDANELFQDRYISVMGLAGLVPGSPWYRYLGAETGPILGPTSYGTKLKQYIDQLALSDAGAFFVDHDGIMTLEERYNLFNDATRTTAQQTFSDNTGTPGIPFEQIIPGFTPALANLAQMAGISGRLQQVGDTGISTFSGLAVTDQHLDLFVRADTEAYARAEYDVALHAKDYNGPIGLTYEVTESDAALDAALHTDLRYRVTTSYTPPGLATFNNDVFVEQIVHTIPVQASPNTWKVSYLFAPCAPYDALDSIHFLHWDTGHWDTDKWGP